MSLHLVTGVLCDQRNNEVGNIMSDFASTNMSVAYMHMDVTAVERGIVMRIGILVNYMRIIAVHELRVDKAKKWATHESFSTFLWTSGPRTSHCQCVARGRTLHQKDISPGHIAIVW